jgi:hypothetical protein
VAFLSKPVPAGDKAPVTAVQPSAIATRDSKPVLFVVADGKVRQVPVTSGRKVGELVEVTGVKPGDKVVSSPDARLHDGQPVSMAKK